MIDDNRPKSLAASVISSAIELEKPANAGKRDENAGKSSFKLTAEIRRSWPPAANKRKPTQNAPQVSHSLRHPSIRDFLSIFARTTESMILSANGGQFGEFIQHLSNFQP